MIKISHMGRKKLGKEKYHFTCPPELMTRFDEIALAMGLTRSDMIVAMIRERVAKLSASFAPEKARRKAR